MCKQNFDKEKAKRYIVVLAKKYKEDEERVISDEYLNWLEQFVHRIISFYDEANIVAYCNEYTEEEKENIYVISVLYNAISNYYDKNNIEYDVEESEFFNQAVTVNLSRYTTIEMRLWRGQGTVTNVTLIDAGSGKVNIEDIVAFAKGD